MFFSKLLESYINRANSPTNNASIRESNSYGLIAEPLCTLSNIPMFAVAFYYEDPALMFAATASALSHAILKQGLHDLDLVGVGLIALKAIIYHDVILHNPHVLLIGALAVSVNALDTVAACTIPRKFQPGLHAFWHCMAAMAMQQFDAAIHETHQLSIF